MYKKVLCLIFVLGLTGSASATDYFWDGGAGDNLWDSANNWNPNGTPGSSDAASNR